MRFKVPMAFFTETEKTIHTKDPKIVKTIPNKQNHARGNPILDFKFNAE
jgi:hypothetical protein